MTQKEYLLENGIVHIQKEIQKRLEVATDPIVVLVAGGTASGKTSAVAKKIKDAFAGSQILSMDNYYRGHAYYKKHNLNFDQPEALNLELFFEHLAVLKSGKSVKIPEYDFKKGTPEFDKITIEPSKIIIVEGLFALDDTLASLGDLKIFVDLGVHSQILRRLFRDVERTGDKPKDILNYFLDVVYKMHKKYIEPTKKNADLILLNDYSPKIESKNAKNREDRLKYIFNVENSKEVLGELIYKMGGSYVGKTEQTDFFFDPKGKYNQTDELLIIRKFGFERYFFMYFGPDNKNTTYDDRYTMKFFTDYHTLQEFKTLYPNVVEYSKLRRSFYVDGILVCLDKLENGETYIVFKFDSVEKKAIIEEILTSLEIDEQADKVEENFFEIMRNK